MVLFHAFLGLCCAFTPSVEAALACKLLLYLHPLLSRRQINNGQLVLWVLEVPGTAVSLPGPAVRDCISVFKRFNSEVTIGTWQSCWGCRGSASGVHPSRTKKSKGEEGKIPSPLKPRLSDV